MIATILLVAITVVLAAVLYLVVSNESHGSASVPLGSELYAGPASAGIVGTPATNAFCQKSHYCYSVPIDEAGGGLVVGEVNLEVLAATGAAHVVSKSFAAISIVDEKNAVVASSKISKNAVFTVTQWQRYGAGYSVHTSLSDLQMIWVQFGNTASSPFHQGYSLQILGVGSFSGSVGVALP
ncbi:MAG: archaellin/type IV pilin N-terminal domain-containing protein [Thermoplasmata archaeon]